MRRLRFRPVFALALALAAASAARPVAAETEFEGRTAGGAHFKAVVPDGWDPEKGLVIWNHGFSLDPIGPVSDLGPLVDLQLTEGYAVAASSYRQIGWAVFKSDRDLEAMVRAFSQRFGRPGRIIVTGASLGGIVTASALERANLGNVVGAFTACGAMAGSRNWDGALDLRLLYDAICSEVDGAAIPGGARGVPRGSELTSDEILAAVDACLGILEPKGRRTRQQKKRLKKLSRLAGIPTEFVATDMLYVTLAMGDLVNSRDKLRGKIGTGNEGVDYDNAEINEAIERVSPKRRAARRLARNFTPQGDVGDVKIVNLHTSKDGLVLVENQREYAEVVPEENLVVGIVAERRPSHCGFSPAEVVGAWEAFQVWLEGFGKPQVSDLQAACELVAALFGGPCRFDPDFEIPDMDGRVRPR